MTETVETNLFGLLILLVVFVITYFLIIKKGFDKNMAAALGALASVLIGGFIGLFSHESFFTISLGHDYLILAVLLGNLLIVAVASEVGIFQYISIKLLKYTKGHPGKLYWTLGTLTFLLSSIINTIPAILVVGALTIVATKELGYNPKPYILMEIVITNSGGLTTLISSITNIIIATPFNISFLGFITIASPLAIILSIVSMLFMMKIAPYQKVEKEVLEENYSKIASFNANNLIKDPTKFKLTSIAFILTMISLLISDIIGIEIAVVAVGGGLIMMYVAGLSLEKILPKVDWTLLSFFASLFIIIKALELAGLLVYLTNILLFILELFLAEQIPVLGATTILLFSSLFSGLLDNVVLAVALTPVLGSIASSSANFHVGSMVWALIIGTNLGGGLTPIGAPPGVLGLGILKKESGIYIGWGEFFKSVGLITILRILLSIIYIAILTLLDSSSLIQNPNP